MIPSRLASTRREQCHHQRKLLRFPIYPLGMYPSSNVLHYSGNIYGNIFKVRAIRVICGKTYGFNHFLFLYLLWAHPGSGTASAYTAEAGTAWHKTSEAHCQAGDRDWKGIEGLDIMVVMT